MNRKALPDDVEDFFKGTPVFFQPQGASEHSSPPPSSSPSTPTVTHTERSNGRTDERAIKRTSDRVNGATERGKEPSKTTSTQPIKQSVDTQPVVPESPNDGEQEELPATGESILERLKLGKSDAQEHTERYSFEIYRKQKEQIEDFLYEYKKKTGEKLSASKLIREALNYYFQTIQNAKNR